VSNKTYSRSTMAEAIRNVAARGRSKTDSAGIAKTKP
jgi:protein-tyrosine-phosphatase